MLRGRKLLIVDDSVTIQKVVDLTFSDEGMEVIAISDGQKAVESLPGIRPDIVLADIFMPGMTGYKLCEYIKQHEQLRNIPVILLVGSFEPFDKEEARRVGADDYLTKPFQSIRQLIKKVKGLLGGTSDEESGLLEPSPNKIAKGKENSAESPGLVNPTGPQEISLGDHRAATGGLPETIPGSGDSPFDDLTDLALESRFAEFGKFETKGLASPVERKTLAEDLETELHKETSLDTQNSHSVSKPGAVSSVDEPVIESFHHVSSVLDLGEVESSTVASRQNDSILDIDYEEVGPAVGIRHVAQVAPQPAGEQSNVEQHALSETYTGSVHRPLAAQPEHSEFSGSETQSDQPQMDRASSGRRTISAVDLSSDAVEMIALRVIEHLSEKVIREIAWEVVPQLAELLVKERLENKGSKDETLAPNF